MKIDADLLGHQAYAPGTDAYRQVVETFGKGVELEDGSGINRRALGAIVFGQKDKMKQLTDIVWPAIRKLALGAFEAVREEAKHSNEDRIVVFEAAVLVEAGWQDVVDEVWVLELPVEVAKQRLMNRNSLSEADALQRINSQLSNEERTKGAHVVISADGTPDEVKARVHEEWQKFLERKHVHPKP